MKYIKQLVNSENNNETVMKNMIRECDWTS